MDTDPNTLSAVEKARLLKQQKEEEKKAEEQKQRDLEEQQKQLVQEELQDIDTKLQQLAQEKTDLESRLISVRDERKKNILGQRKAVQELKSSKETEDILNEDGIKEEIFSADDTALEGIKNQEDDIRQKIQKLEEGIAELQEKRTEVYHKTPEGLTELQAQQKEQLYSEIQQEIQQIRAPKDIRYLDRRAVESFDILRDKFGDEIVKEYYLAPGVSEIEKKYQNKEEQYQNIEDFFAKHSNEALRQQVSQKFDEFQKLNSSFQDFVYKHSDNRFVSQFHTPVRENYESLRKLVYEKSSTSLMKLDALSTLIDQRMKAIQFRQENLQKLINNEVDPEQEQELENDLRHLAYDENLRSSNVKRFNISQEEFVSAQDLFDDEIFDKLRKIGVNISSDSPVDSQQVFEQIQQIKERELTTPKNAELEILHLDYEAKINEIHASRLNKDFNSPIGDLKRKQEKLKNISENVGKSFREIYNIKTRLSENLNKPVVFDDDGFCKYEGAAEIARQEIENIDHAIEQKRTAIEELNQKLQKKKTLFQSAGSYQKEKEEYQKEKEKLSTEIQVLFDEQQQYKNSDYVYPRVGAFFTTLVGTSYGNEHEKLTQEFLGKFGKRFETLDDLLKKMEEFATEKEHISLSEEEQVILENETNIDRRIDELRQILFKK